MKAKRQTRMMSVSVTMLDGTRGHVTAGLEAPLTSDQVLAYGDLRRK